jgi:hypothetical protein
MSFAIAWKPGRACGYGSGYATREEAQRILDGKRAAGWAWAEQMHVIETSGGIGAEFPGAPEGDSQ